MKKFLLFALLIFGKSMLFSQINKNQWLAGGSVSLSTSKSESQGRTELKLTTIQLAPNVGYFVIDKLAVGIKLNFANSKYDCPGINSNESSQQLSLAPFARFYFLPKKEKVNFFADAGYFYGNTKRKFFISGVGGGTTRNIDELHGYSITAGPAIFLNPNTALELTLSYSNTKLKDSYSRTKMLAFGIGLQIHLGK